MSNQLLNITEEASEVMIADALNAFPNECCGFFYGSENENERIITIAKPVVNSKEGDQRRRFEISPFDYMKAEQFALQNGLLLLGVYHSHPNHPSVASIHDLAKAMPYFSYVIISVMKGKLNTVQSWRLKEDVREFEEEKVNIYKIQGARSIESGIVPQIASVSETKY
ncbi:MAG: M67 family metallopeptidase [Chitinophagales bacterium]